MQSSLHIYDSTKLQIESDSIFLKNNKATLSQPKNFMTNPKHHQINLDNKQHDQSNMHLYQTGRWSHEENRQFIEALFIYGTDWKQVQSYIKTRTSIQSRSHAQKFFINFNKKYIEAYGTSIDDSEDSPLKAYTSKQVLAILSKMHHCDFIAKLCNNMSHMFHGDYINILFDKLNQTSTEKPQYNINPSIMEKFIKEKTENFIKAICGLMQVSSRTKNNSIQRPAKNDMNKACPIIQNSNDYIMEDCNDNVGHSDGDNGDEHKIIHDPSDDSNETNGTAQNAFDSQLNMGLSIENLFHFGGIESSEYDEGRYVDHMFNIDLPYYFGASN